MQRISQWSLRCLMHSRAAPFASGSPRWNPPPLRDYPFNLAAPDLAAKLLGVGGLCRVVKKFYGTTEGIDKAESKGIHDSEATATDRLPDGIVYDRDVVGTDDRVCEGKIWEESTHRDGAIYKKNWGFYGSGRPINLADRRETDLESYMSSKLSPCYPYTGSCTRHPSDEMIQVCSLRLAKTPMNSDSVQLYGYLAARDFLDGRLNYVFNRSRDNPLTVQKGKLIEMTGPTRGIVIFAEVLMEFDMRIKTGEREEDDLQLIDGVAFFSNRELVASYTLRFSGCHGGAVDMRFADIEYGMEAVIEVDVPEVNSAFNLSLVSALEEYGEIELFHGDITELGTKRFVIAVPDDTMMYLKFIKVCKEGTEGDLLHYCKIDTSRHGCVSQQIVLDCILVKVSILSPDPHPYP